MSRSHGTLGWGLAALTVLALGCAPDEGGLEGPATFVTTLGDDTVTVETFTRTDTRIEGVLVQRTPFTQRISYAVDLNPDGTFARLQADVATPAENPDGPEAWSAATTIADGMATVERIGGDNPGTNSFEVGPGALPTLGRATMAFFALEQAMRQAEEGGGEGEFPLELVYPTRPQPVANAITPLAGDTIAFSFFGLPFRAWAADGRVMGADGMSTTMKAQSIRVPSLDIDALAAAWARADADGKGLGVPSPPATTAATIAGATMEVVYSQPAKRGREIWGGLVPHGEVWRTGANSATVFTTDRDLVIGGAEVPAGSYTLWTLFTPDSQQLIINTQTGQWGTDYDEEMDLVRVDLTEASLSEMMERFTISLTETDEGGTLHLGWDRTEYTVPIHMQ